MRVIDHEIKLKPSKLFTDLTPQIEQWLASDMGGIDVSDMEELTGILHIQSMHTTACVRVLEHEPFLEMDTRDMLNNYINPRYNHDGYLYKHNDIELRDVDCPCERKNAHSHLQSLFFGSGETMLVTDGKLDKGVWQSIMFIDLDREPVRSRKVKLRLLV